MRRALRGTSSHSSLPGRALVQRTPRGSTISDESDPAIAKASNATLALRTAIALRQPPPLTAIRRAAATVLGTGSLARPRHARTVHGGLAVPRGPRAVVISCDQKADCPTPLAPHLLRRRVGFLFGHAGLEMRTVLAGKRLAPGGGQAALQVFLARPGVALA